MNNLFKLFDYYFKIVHIKAVDWLFHHHIFHFSAYNEMGSKGKFELRISALIFRYVKNIKMNIRIGIAHSCEAL